MKSLIKLSFSLLVSLTLVSWAPAQVRPSVVVKVGHIGTMADGPFYIGLEKGYFKERGIELSLERFATGGAMMAPLTRGDLHVGGGAISVGFFNAIARRFPLLIIANRNRNLPGFSQDAIWVRADLADRIKGPADLKGKKIAHPGAGSVTEYMMLKYLEPAGMTKKDANVVYLPFPDMRVAFINKAIEAAIGPEPFVTQYEALGLTKTLTRVSAFIRPMVETSALFANVEWAKQNRQTLNDFMVAYLKGVREFYEASIRRPNRAEVIDFLVKHTGIKDRALFDKMEWLFIDPNGEIEVPSLTDQQDVYLKNGMITEKADLTPYIDHSFAKYAVDQLGYYRR